MLSELLEAVDTLAVRGATDREVRGLCLDSRHVSPGEAFFALPGVHADGARFAADAVAAGASAVFGGAGLEAIAGTVVEVAEPRLALAQAAVRFFGHPSRELGLVAVTGTNGKTTTTWLVEAMLTAWGRRAGLIGTTGVRMAGELSPSPFTTPEAPDLQGLLARMRAVGVTHVALEASSHALVQRRTWGLACDACVFTNLTQDHLDYHGTMDAYLDAKLMLFDGRNGGREKPCVAVVNADDPAGPRVAEAAARGGMRTVFFGSPAAVGERDGVTIARADVDRAGLRLALVERAAAHVTERPCVLPMLGRYNAWNAAAACREHTPGRVLLVFGCGGDRDRGKRPLMGAVAARAADRAWVTNDNPRSEDPKAIAEQILAGVPQGAAAKFEILLDRRAALAAALAEARPGDLVLAAGKGHETTQTAAGVVTPFDDRVVARELLGAGSRAGAA